MCASTTTSTRSRPPVSLLRWISLISLIPLRNRRTTPDGDQLHTRITEAMTRFECGGHTGIGMSEYLDQIVDGRPVGIDAESA